MNASLELEKIWSTNDERVAAVKMFAIENYGTDGWDIVVETMNDLDIYNLVKYTHSPKGAIRKMATQLTTISSVRSDIQGS